MDKKSDPWYVHAALYVVIAILTIVLIKVAIIDPRDYVEAEKYYKSESRLRMENIKEAEIFWQRKYGNYTDNLDSIINFVKYDPYVDSITSTFDSLIMKIPKRLPMVFGWVMNGKEPRSTTTSGRPRAV